MRLTHIKQVYTKGTLSKQRIIILISGARQVRPTRLFAQRDTTSYW